MAVRTQHASSYFFSNGQEDNDCSSLQPQQPKEVSSVDFIQFSSPAAAPMNPPPPKPQQAIDLSELLQNHNRLKFNVVPTTCLRSSQDHRSHNQEQLLSTFSMLSGDLGGEYKRQIYELDMFLQTQVFV